MFELARLFALPIRRRGNFVFLTEADLPQSSYRCDNVPLSDISWATTSEFNEHAYYHCGAVCITNLCLYFVSRGRRNLFVKNDKSATFDAVHSFVGNGPKLTVAYAARRFFRTRYYRLKHRQVKNFSEFAEAIAADRPVALLLAESLFNWHWVVALGWRKYESGEIYLRIVNGWENSSERFYLVQGKDRLAAATAYWITT